MNSKSLGSPPSLSLAEPLDREDLYRSPQDDDQVRVRRGVFVDQVPDAVGRDEFRVISRVSDAADGAVTGEGSAGF